MKKHLLILLISVVSMHLRAQSLSPQVYAPAGSFFSGQKAQLEFTIGEPLTLTYAGTLTITQGFHQPVRVSTGVQNPEHFVFKIYPNPSGGHITVSTEQEQAAYQLEILDIYGRTLLSRQMQGATNQVDVSALPCATYFARIRYENGKTNSFTIIKANQ